MKKTMTLALGMSLALGTATLGLADEKKDHKEAPKDSHKDKDKKDHKKTDH